MSETSLSVHGGILCGLQFLLIFQLAELTGVPVPRALADKEIRGVLQKRPFFFKGCGRNAMQKNWTKYRGAAHLWAAFNVFGRWPDDENELLQFCSLAELFRVWGEGYRARGATEHFLDRRVTWKLTPETPARPVTVRLTSPDGRVVSVNLAINGRFAEIDRAPPSFVKPNGAK